MKSINPDILGISFKDKNLCTRCGTCIGICPTGALLLDKNLFPKIDPEKCIECGKCCKMCPGGKVNFKEMTEITFGHSNPAPTFDGHYQRIYIGHSNDQQIHDGGAGGGVITTMAWYMLKEKLVDGVIVTRMNPEKPWQGQVYIARTFEELLASQQSKYVVIPTNTILGEIRKLNGKYLFIGLPCQIHGIRLVQKHQPKLAEKIVLAIGLFCASSMEPYVTTEMMKTKGVKPASVKEFQFRGGKWPGRIRVVKKDGSIKNLHYSNFKDGAINYLTYLYSPIRCQTCIDGSAEFADISVSDAWARDESGNYLFKGSSRLIVRTDAGVQAVEQAINKGYLQARNYTNDEHYMTKLHHTRKKGITAPLRIKRLQQKGIAVPEYDRPAPAPSRDQVRTERSESFIMELGRHDAIRYSLFKFLTSIWGVPLVKIRQFRKSIKYRK